MRRAGPISGTSSPQTITANASPARAGPRTRQRYPRSADIPPEGAAEAGALLLPSRLGGEHGSRFPTPLGDVPEPRRVILTAGHDHGQPNRRARERSPGQLHFRGIHRGGEREQIAHVLGRRVRHESAGLLPARAMALMSSASRLPSVVPNWKLAPVHFDQQHAILTGAEPSPCRGARGLPPSTSIHGATSDALVCPHSSRDRVSTCSVTDWAGRGAREPMPVFCVVSW